MIIRFSTIITAFLCIIAVKTNFADVTSAQMHSDTVVYIRAVEIYGNVTTRPEILKRFITFDIGDQLDTSALRVTRNNLIRTQLFEGVNVFPHIREDGAHVFIVLKEAVRLSLGYSGEYGTHKYGREKLWWSVHLDAGLHNFRGQFEDISGGVSFWERRGVRASWDKPFLSTPYSIGAAAAISIYPDEWLPLDYRDISARITAGRRVGRYSQVSLSAIPIMRHRTVREEIMLGNDATVIPLSTIPNIYEAFGVLSFVNDLRSSRFDPQKGWYLRNEIRTNRLYYDLTEPFVQFRNDFRYYLPMLFDDMMALRLSVTLRDSEAGYYHRLLYGDAGQIRGYNQKELGWNFIANSSVLISAKYHKPVWKAPALKMPLVNTVYSGVNEISYRLDAALIADYARLYKDPHGVLLFEGPAQSGMGFGGGIRIVIPEIRQSGCIDIVWGRKETLQGSSHEWKKVIHLYFDLFY